MLNIQLSHERIVLEPLLEQANVEEVGEGDRGGGCCGK
jgi:hypothetical protein